MNDLFSRLSVWGVSMDATMERFLNDRDLYRDCLHTFMNDENFDLLKQAMSQQRYEDAFVSVHTLKGVAANLGLEPMVKPLSALTEELRHHTYQNMDAYCQQIAERKAELEDILHQG